MLQYIVACTSLEDDNLKIMTVPRVRIKARTVKERGPLSF